MRKHYNLYSFTQVLFLFSLVLLPFTSFSQAGCPSDYSKEYTWPTHTNWYFGQAKIMNFGTNGTTAPTLSTMVGAGAPYTCYESCASASDEFGNLIFYTNGVGLWDAAGNAIPIPGGRLLTGAENAAGNAGSAVQGVYITKHPLDDNNYYIFTTDDAISGEANGITNGFNYYIYDRGANTVSGATRLGNYRTTEQVAATFHNNGVDIWIVTHESSTTAATNTYHAYLLECSGLTTTPVSSNAGFQVIANAGAGGYSNERASLQFQYGSGATQNIKAAATHHCGGGTWDPVNSISVLDFDRLTGQFTFDRGLGDGSVRHSNPYDCEFSPNGNRIYVTLQSDQWSGPLRGEIGYFPIGGGAFTSLAMENAAGTTDIGAIKLGGDGNMYAGGFAKSPWGYLTSLTRVTNPDGAASATVGAVNSGASTVGYGLPNMFIPPLDSVQIQDPGALTDCDLPVDLACLWRCKGTSAENTPRYENAWSVKAGEGTSINAVTGVFNAPGSGTYTVYFEICTLRDTLTFTIDPCNCTTTLQDITPEICVGETYTLDALVTGQSGPSTWTIDSVPTSVTNDAVITTGTDTVFDASALDTKPGTYKLKFTNNADANCFDSIYLVVKPLPVVDINPIDDLCEDSIATTMTSDSTNGTFNWFIDDVQKNAPFEFDPTTFTQQGASDQHEIKLVYTGQNGCENRDSITVNVLERKDASFTMPDSVCAGEVANLTATNAGGTWTSECDANSCVNTVSQTFISANSGVGDFKVFYEFAGKCGDKDTDSIRIKPVRDATIVNQDTSMCWNAPNWNIVANFAGGVWSVNGVDVPGNLQTTVFDPKLIPDNGSGGPISPIVIRYRFDGMCGDTDSVVVTIVDTAAADISTTKGTFCLNDAAHQLSLNGDGGGTWSGPGVDASGLFNPTTAGVTTPGNPHVIKYLINTACPDSDTIQIWVNPMKDATITDSPTNDTISACILDGTKIFNVAEAGGTFNVYNAANANIGNGALTVAGTQVTIDVSAATGLGQGVFAIEHIQANPCGDTDTVWINIVSKLDATINAVPDSVCITAASFPVTFVAPGAGVVKINGTTVPEPVTFDPATIGAGLHEIAYQISGGCGDSDTVYVFVQAEPIAELSLPKYEYCEGDNFELINVGNSTAGWQLSATPNENGLDKLGPVWDPRNSGTGDFKLTLSVSNEKCTADSTVDIKVKPIPSFTFNYPLDTVCDSASTIQLDMTVNPANATSTWSNNPNVSPTGLFTVPKGVTSAYVMRFEASLDGCSRDTNVQIIIKKMFDPTFTLQAQICNTANAFNLVDNITGDQGGLWAGPGITDNLNGTFDPATAGQGTHNITYSDAGKCGASLTLPIEVLIAKDPTIQPVASVCAGSGTIQLVGGPDANGTWGGPGVSSTGTFNPTDSGSFYATYSYPNDLCPSDTDTVNFYIKYVPRTNFTATPRDSCIPFTPVFTDISDSTAVQSLWTFGNGQTSTSLGTTSSTYTEEGCHTVTLANVYANGCQSDTTFDDYICGRGIPVADFTWSPNPPDIYNNQVSFFNNSTGGDSFEWYFDSTNANPNPVTSTAQVSQLVTYTADDADTPRVRLIAISQYGCRDTIIKPVPIRDVFSLYIANAFTPNGDGRNDTFFPLGRNLEFGQDYEFLVFNRWGSLIWKSNIPYEGWDGTVTQLSPTSLETAQIDVYVWKLNVTDPYTGDKHKLVGHVSLIR